jgi:membrane peptidoglycan carboxypeptidase
MIRAIQALDWLRSRTARLRPHAQAARARVQVLMAMAVLLAGRLRDGARPLLARLREAAVRAGGRLRDVARHTGPAMGRVREQMGPQVQRAADAAEAAGARLRPVVETLPPQAERARTTLPHALSGTLDGVLPVASRAMDAVRHQVEAGRDAHTTPRELRDTRGRRLRASAYAYGPDGTRNGRRRVRQAVPHVAGSLLPAGLKVAMVVVIAGFGFLGSSSAYINYAADLPDAHSITSTPLLEDTLIYASDGTLLADLHPRDQPQHYYESLDQMGRWLPAATVAVEDSGFWTEPGIDVFAMGRAAWIDWRSKQPVQGASTITQQLVKIRLTGNKTSIDRKVKEAVLAIQVEHTYTKRQILEQYLNSVDYGNNSRGSLAAARVYFHVDSRDLDLAQASMLAGIPQSPLYNNPFTNWQQAKRRQLQVLDAMVRTHQVTQEQADEAYAEDLTPPAHMFQPTQQIVAAKSFVDWVEQGIAGLFGARAVTGGGLHVVTTLNMRLQAAAEKAVVDQVNYGRTRYHESQGSMTAIDPRTGAVVAMVGSAGQDTPGGKYDFSWDTTTPRSPGSSMKIFTYTAAIASGKYTMATMIPDTPVTVNPGQGAPLYQPKNYDGGYHGTLQLQQAMGNSYNVPAVKVEMTIGVPTVVNMARAMGAPPVNHHNLDDGTVQFTTDDSPSSFGPSLTLGGYGETPLQMATGASVLGAQGMYHQPYGIAAISASGGTRIFTADPNRGARQVLDPKVAFIMEQIMSNDQNRVKAFGANSDLTLPGRRVGAKTGTSEQWGDGWTVGYTPSLASAFWFGNSDNSLMAQGADGIYTAAPAWHAFMMAALNALNAPATEWFAEPPGLGHATVGGEPVWYLPNTNPNQPMPALPPGTSSSGAPPPRGQNGNNPG